MEIICIQTEISGFNLYTFKYKVKDLVPLCYVAARGQSEEEGAVQRILSQSRVEPIRDYVLKGESFPTNFIINWTNKEIPNLDKISINLIQIPRIEKAAQVLDGQHRLAGLQKAFEKEALIGERELIVTMAIGLSNQDAAKIFLNINREQKPVPISLVYDLFGLIDNPNEATINRARDLAIALNEDESSPYKAKIKFPGKGSGIIELSTVVNGLKNDVITDTGAFPRANVMGLDKQKAALINFFNAVKYFYDKQDTWEDKKQNPFLKSSGFGGALDYFFTDAIEKCKGKRSFSTDTFKSILALDKKLLTFDEIKGLDGKTARKRIKAYLANSNDQVLPKEEEYEF